MVLVLVLETGQRWGDLGESSMRGAGGDACANDNHRLVLRHWSGRSRHRVDVCWCVRMTCRCKNERSEDGCGVLVLSSWRLQADSREGHTVDALASGAEEGRDQAAKGLGEPRVGDDPGISEWGNPPLT